MCSLPESRTPCANSRRLRSRGSEWKSNGAGAGKEKGICKKTGKTLIEISPRYFRPSDAKSLLGDPSKAGRELGWKAETKFRRLAEIMADADFELAKAEAKL